MIGLEDGEPVGYVVGERLVGDELTGALDGESVDGTEVAGILVGGIVGFLEGLSVVGYNVGLFEGD
jgi:hypothetical protein